MMIQLLLLLNFFKTLNSGHIYSLDMTTQYSNAYWLETLKLNFNLESGLAKKEFLQLGLPYYLGSQPSAYL